MMEGVLSSRYCRRPAVAAGAPQSGVLALEEKKSKSSNCIVTPRCLRGLLIRLLRLCLKRGRLARRASSGGKRLAALFHNIHAAPDAFSFLRIACLFRA